MAATRTAPRFRRPLARHRRPGQDQCSRARTNPPSSCKRYEQDLRAAQPLGLRPRPGIAVEGHICLPCYVLVRRFVGRRIEGVNISHRRPARAAYQANKGQLNHRAAEVLGNVEALERATELGTDSEPLRVADIEDIPARRCASPSTPRSRRHTQEAELNRWQRLRPRRRQLRATAAPNTSHLCSRTCARSSTATTSAQSPGPRSPTRSSRPSIIHRRQGPRRPRAHLHRAASTQRSVQFLRAVEPVPVWHHARHV